MKTGVPPRLVPWLISGTAVLHIGVVAVPEFPLGEMAGEEFISSVDGPVRLAGR